jgi:hypothetical protein
MIKSKKKFSIFFWALFLVMVAVYSMIAGTIEKANYIQVKGKVISKVSVPEYYMYEGIIKTKTVSRPEISYPVENGSLSFIPDKTKMDLGKTPTLLYSKTDPKNVRIYNLSFWVHFDFVFPAFLIACFLYTIGMITMTRYEAQAEVLPGELDPFVYNDPEQLEA